MMAGNLFSWVFRPNPTSPTMAQPSQRTLWCAFSDKLQRPFSVDCTLNVDTIDKFKERIWLKSQNKISQTDYFNLDLYSPTSPVRDNVTQENLIYLCPRKQISSDFPQSNDPDLDIIIIRPEEQQQLTALQGIIPHLILYTMLLANFDARIGFTRNQ
jgi:hypothetical protein